MVISTYSEDQVQRHLKETRTPYGMLDHSEMSARSSGIRAGEKLWEEADVVVWCVEAGMVKKIECVESVFQAEPFS